MGTQMRKAYQHLPELSHIERCLEQLEDWGRAEILGHVHCDGFSFPIHAIVFGPEDPGTPILGIFAGVHGLENVGTHVAIHYLSILGEALRWDRLTREMCKSMRIAIVPLINPGGMFLRKRSNPQGIDLMRNAPVEAEDLPFFKPLSGQRFSRRLPWFRGHRNASMELEAQAVCAFFERQFIPAKVAVALDIHSGFGFRDRLWFPFAKSKKPLPHLPEVYALLNLLEETHPNNVYKIEPQSASYTTHGDLWDYLYGKYHAANSDQKIFIPLTLEMGSWAWLKKNPKQIFSPNGPFNPVVYHRYQRTMRRHTVLLDFLARSVYSYQAWAFPDSERRAKLKHSALHQWYPPPGVR